MVAYCPPHMRNKNGAAEKDDSQSGEPREQNNGGKNGGYANDRGNRRFDDLKTDSPRGGKKGGGKGKRGDNKGGDRERNGNDDNSAAANGHGGGRVTAMQAGVAGGSWKSRSDGRRSGPSPTELEVFGEVKERSSAGIDFDKYDAIPVQLTGTGVDEIKPIERFSEAKLTDSLFENLRRCGYERPTPVQKNSIPIVISGRDLMACAQTGSGKTCAFMVPCLESLLRSGPPDASGGGRRKPMPCGLVLAPTRELASQIHVESCKFSFDTGIRCCIIYGGADMREQRQEMEKGCDILIATPGRLTDMCERHALSLELIQFFILDEADRMLDMGFEPQVRAIVDNHGMGRNSKHPRQSMMFSATFAREVQLMAQDFLEDYVFITVGRVGSASEMIAQHVVYAGELKAKVIALERAIKEYLPKDGLAVIFVETKRAADSLELDLHEAGVRVTAIHGDRSQTEREEALHAFKTGANPVLVATDVAARGLDIPNVALVVNFDMPKQLDDYVHRIGRTGRAGRKGVAVAFVNERCQYLSELGSLLVEAKQDPPLWFSDLCRSAGGRRPGKGGASRFGAQDLRASQQNGDAAKAAAPARSTFSAQPARAADAFGNSGADDAW